MVSRNLPLAAATSVALILLYAVYGGEDERKGKDFASPLRLPPWHVNRTYKYKTVLYWNDFYGAKDVYDFGFGREAFAEKCLGVAKDCFATADRSLMGVDEFDAVLIHIRGLPNDWPSERKPHQR